MSRILTWRSSLTWLPYARHRLLAQRFRPGGDTRWRLLRIGRSWLDAPIVPRRATHARLDRVTGCIRVTSVGFHHRPVPVSEPSVTVQGAGLPRVHSCARDSRHQRANHSSVKAIYLWSGRFQMAICRRIAAWEREAGQVSAQSVALMPSPYAPSTCTHSGPRGSGGHWPA